MIIMDMDIKLSNKEQQILIEAKRIINKLDDIICSADGIVSIDKISWNAINAISDSSGRVSDMIHIADEED